MSDDDGGLPVSYGSAGKKIADFFMDLAPTTKVGVKRTRNQRVHIIAKESEMEDIARALLAMREATHG